MIDTFSSRLGALRSEDGFVLIEVIISALLVGLIVVGTYSGLVSANRATAHERANAQATVIAQQDEDRLRGLSVKELTNLSGGVTYTVAENGMCVEEVSGVWKYYNSTTTTSCEAVTGFKGSAYTGTVFTVTSSARYVTAAKESFACETSTGAAANYLQTTTSVTWPSVGTHSPVSESSLVAVPSTGTLMVKVKNSKGEPVSGAKVAVFDPSTETTATAEQTTPTAGCVIFGDLTEGSVKAAASKASWVEKTGKAAAEKTTSVKTGSLAEVELTIEDSGGIEAKFVNSSGQPVESSTFVAFQTEMGSPAFAVGGEANKSATSYKLEGLYPFANAYKVYAGDCEENKPSTVGVSGAKEESVLVKPGEVNNTASVEVAPINGKVYQGSKESEGVLAKSESAMIINTACKGKAASNITTITGEHEVKITSGELVPKYQPYAKSLELCVVGEDGTKYYENTFKLENTAKTGSTATPLYLAGTGSKTVSSTTKC